MKQETYIMKVLIPSEGMMLTNGEVVTDKVYLGEADSADNWHEIPAEEETV